MQFVYILKLYVKIFYKVVTNNIKQLNIDIIVHI